ncbi:Rrp12p like nucleolar [Cryptosporidium sp. chipmunk genotype I]|uniref:Rrp12p like nucleolar n=1 Tax=Cryptosporidium sp. chipmunk genotype I TaxID=1280935 RepID=UPI00351AA961|nr:Rrp12p like nucleolar [Cryptosporidium sp. chipmunk genotype I]
MDPLILDVEETLKSLSFKKESYLEAYQSFLIIKDSVVSRNRLCTVPLFINLTFEAIEKILSGNKLENAIYTFKDQKTLVGLLTLQKKILGTLDMNILGTNCLTISQVIINRLVDILVLISKNDHAKIEIFQAASALKQFCSALDSIQLNPKVFKNLMEILLESRIHEKQKIQIQICIIDLLKIVQDNSLILLSIHKLALHYLSIHGQRQLDVSKGFALEYNEQILIPINRLYFSLVHFLDQNLIKEYLSTLLQLCTLKQYRFVSIYALGCLKNQVSLLEKVIFECRYIWIPLYILESLTSDFKEMKDNALIQTYLETCINCLNCVLFSTFEKDIQQMSMDTSIDTFINSLRQFMLTTDTTIHSTVIKSLIELVFKAKESIIGYPKLEKSIEKYVLFELIITKLLPLCSSILGDYRYKLSWPELLRLLIIMIESWDELAIIYYYHNTVELLRIKRSCGIKLFEEVICKTLNMASVALCGISDYSSFEYKDLSNLKEELRRIVGSITRAFGPNLVLNKRPLSFDNVELADHNFAIKSNSWLLPLLRVHITRTELSFFIENLLPIALKLNTYCSEYQATEPNYARLYSILEEQVWALLPGFFDEPLDFIDTFGSNDGNLRSYMIQLLDRPGMRDHICNALLRISRQTFIGRALSNDNEDEFYDAKKMSNIDNRKYYVAMNTWEKNTEALNLHSKTFLSLLIVKFLNCNSECIEENQVNITKEQESQHYLICIQNLVPFCDETVLQTNLKNFYTVWESLAQGVESSRLPFSCGKIIALLDVAIMMFKRISVDKVNSIISYFLRLLRVLLICDSKSYLNERSQLLRRLYKGIKVGLETLRDRNTTLLGLKDQLSEIWKIIILDSGKCPANSLKHRLSCLRVFIQLLKKIDDKEFALCFGKDQIINHLIPEILFSIREPNTTVRINSMALLKSLIECYIESGHLLETIIVKMITLSQVSNGQIKDDYIEVSCIISLSRIVLDYGDLIQNSSIQVNSIIPLIVNFIVHSLKNVNPLTYLNSLKCIKICLYRINTDLLWIYTPNIISNILSNQFCALKFRIHVRKILISLIKKFGAEKIFQVFPPDHSQLYRYLMREMNKSSRKKIFRSNQDIFNDICNEADELETKELTFDDQEFLHTFEYDEEVSSDEDSDSRKKCSFGNKMIHNSQTKHIISNYHKDKSESLTIIDDGYVNMVNPIDLLSSDASSRILSTSSNKIIIRRNKTNDGTVEFDKTLNKVVINEESKLDNIEAHDKSLEFRYKPLTHEGVKSYRTFSNTKNNHQKKKLRKQHVTVKSAKEFKSKNAQGDISKNGMQPFAYLRLNPALSKEKHKLSATKSLSTIFNKKSRIR